MTASRAVNAVSNIRVHLADESDSVMRLVRIVLGGVFVDDESWVSAYFAPEPGDHWSALKGIAAEFGVGERVVLTWSSHGSEEELSEACTDAQVLVLRRGQVTSSVLNACPELRVIIQIGEGTANVDVDEARERGIDFIALPRPSLDRTAEHVLLLALALAHKLIMADANVHNGGLAKGQISQPGDESYNWAGLTGLTNLFGHKLGIIGLGAVGRRVVPLARAFGMEVTYNTRTAISKDSSFDLRHGVEREDLETLLQTSDFVSLHALNIAGAAPVMGAEEFAAMKYGSYFINTSRGRLVDEDALAEAVRFGQLAGAALDVHRVEPRPADHPLCELENVILTPHMAGGLRSALIQEIRELVRVLVDACELAAK